MEFPINTFGGEKQHLDTTNMNKISKRKFVSMRDYEQEGKPIYETIPEPEKMPWARPTAKFPTIQELENILKDNQQDIFYSIAKSE